MTEEQASDVEVNINVEDDDETGGGTDVVIIEDGGGATETDVNLALRLGEVSSTVEDHERRLAEVEGLIALAIDQAERAQDIAIEAEGIAIESHIEASEASEQAAEAAEDASESESEDEITPDGREHWFYKPIGSRA